MDGGFETSVGTEAPGRHLLGRQDKSSGLSQVRRSRPWASHPHACAHTLGPWG